MLRIIVIGLIVIFFVILPLFSHFKNRKVIDKLIKEHKLKKDYRREVLKLSKEIKDPKLRQDFLEENLIITGGSIQNKLRLKKEIILLKWHNIIPSLKSKWRDDIVKTILK
jgi:hypothetical protein